MDISDQKKNIQILKRIARKLPPNDCQQVEVIATGCLVTIKALEAVLVMLDNTSAALADSKMSPEELSKLAESLRRIASGYTNRNRDYDGQGHQADGVVII